MQVKLLGALALVDEEECDWKLFAINLADPKASKWNGAAPSQPARLSGGRRSADLSTGSVKVLDAADISDLPPNVISDVREWYRVYKMADGKPPNRYALNGSAIGKVQ